MHASALQVRNTAQNINLRGLQAISFVCTSRFTSSEQRVYKNFYGNVIQFISDTEENFHNEAGVGAELLKLKSVCWLTGLIGVIDLLRHVKYLSLAMQTVNQLPWELEESRMAFVKTMKELATDLAAGSVDRMIDSLTGGSQQEPALKLLKKHEAEMKRGKFSSPDPKNDSVKVTIDMGLTSQQRSMRNFIGGQQGDAPQSPAAEFTLTLSELSKMATCIAEHVGSKLKPPDSEWRYLRHMANSLDLRKMAFDASYVKSNQAQHSIHVLYKWAQNRDCGYGDGSGGAGAAADAEPINDLPAFEEVRRQHCRLASQLQMFAGDPQFKPWRAASGVVIMKDVFTMERFYAGNEDFIYLFEHMACKTMCEAVIEGMGGEWDRSAPDSRHPDFDTGSETAVVAWNAPHPYHPAAVPFINHALNDVFGFDAQGVPKPWNFQHVDHRHDERRYVTSSLVTSRHKQEDQPRLPTAMYDVSTKP